MMVDLDKCTFYWGKDKTRWNLDSFTIKDLFYELRFKKYKNSLDFISSCCWDREDFEKAIKYYSNKLGENEYINDLKQNLDKYLELLTIKDIIE